MIRYKSIDSKKEKSQKIGKTEEKAALTVGIFKISTANASLIKSLELEVKSSGI